MKINKEWILNYFNNTGFFIKKQKSILNFNLKNFYKRFNNLAIKDFIKILLILLALSYLSILTRIVLYGIPFELIEMKNIIISTQSYFLRSLLFPSIIIALLFYSLFKSIVKGLKKEFFSFEIIFLILLIIIGIFDLIFNYKIANEILPILLLLMIIIFIVDITINFKKYQYYIKIFFLSIIIIVSYNLTKEGINLIRYETLSNYKHFDNDSVFSDIVFNYILEYKKPYIAKVRIDNKNNSDEIIILGNYSGYLYYYPKKTIENVLLNNKIKDVVKNKICKKVEENSKNKFEYPQRIVELLKTSVLRTRKFERKSIKRIKIETEYISFEDSFCKKINNE